MFKFKFNTRTLAYLALLTALLMVFSFTPIGTIPIGPLSITLNIIPVAIAAIALGPIGGLIIGSVFGILSYLQCFSIGIPSGMGQVLVGISPVLAFIQRFVPRALDGFLVGVIYYALNKLYTKFRPRTVSTVLSSIVAVILAVASVLVIRHGIIKNSVPETAAEHPGSVFIIFGIIAAVFCAGFIALAVYNAVSRKDKGSDLKPACFIAGFLSAFLNTAFFMTALVVLFGNTEYIQKLMDGRGFFEFLFAFVGINALVEIVVSTLVSGGVGSALYRAKLLPIGEKSRKGRKSKKK